MKKAYKINKAELERDFGSYRHNMLVVNQSGQISYSPAVEKDIECKLPRIISEAYKGNNIISADKIIRECFSQEIYDVFISYSSQDVECARNLKNFIQNELGLRCFLDCDVWENAYKVMRNIDDELNLIDYSIKLYDYVKLYDYEGCRQSSINVSMMLTSALTLMLERCQVIIFICSENSISNLNGNNRNIVNVKDKTYSPWLYHEISTVNMMNRIQSDKGALIKAASEKIEYSLDLSQFETIDANCLLDWKRKKQNPNINLLKIITK